MLTKEDLQLLSDMLDNKLDEKLKPIQQDISQMKDDIAQMKEDIDILKEDTTEVRVTVDEICKWIDLNFSHKYPFPIDRNVG